MDIDLILASQSTNRRRLLEQVCLKFRVVVSDYEEDMTLDLPPRELVKELALGKAQGVAAKNPDSIVIGADTVFLLNGKVGGKPKDNTSALEMLKLLRETPHQFVTGYAIVSANKNLIIQGSATVEIELRKDLTDSDLENYIKLEKEAVTTKAGGYDGANLGAALILTSKGDFSSYLGLPLGEVLSELKKLGINPLA